MEGAHADQSTFIYYLGYLPGDGGFEAGEGGKEVLAIHPGIKTDFGVGNVHTPFGSEKRLLSAVSMAISFCPPAAS